MIQQLLGELEKGGAVSVPVLANRIGVSMNMIEAMLEDLARRGLLREAPQECNGAAYKGCALASGCGQAAQPRVWQLTKRVVGRNL